MGLFNSLFGRKLKGGEERFHTEDDEDYCLYHSKNKMIFYFIMCVLPLILIFGVLDMTKPKSWIGVAVMGPLAIFYLITWINPKLFYIRLTLDQLELHGFYTEVHKWQEIGYFQVVVIKGHKIVYFYLMPRGKKFEILRRMIPFRVLHCNYGLSAEKMADLLNRWRDRAISRKGEWAR
jgi:hypothetical protein